MNSSSGNGTIWGILCAVLAVIGLCVANRSATFVAKGYAVTEGKSGVIVRVDQRLEDTSNAKYAVISAIGLKPLILQNDAKIKPDQFTALLTNDHPAPPSTTINISDLTEAEGNVFQKGSLLWVTIPRAEWRKSGDNLQIQVTGNWAEPCPPAPQNETTTGQANQDTSACTNKTEPLKTGTFGTVAMYSAPAARFFILLASLAWLALFAQALIPRGLHTGMKRLIIGKDNRLSNAQFQMFMWFLVFIAGYLSTMIWRIASGQPHLALGIISPETLIALTGLTAGTLVAAKALTSSGVNTGEIVKPTAPEPKVENLYSDDLNRFDFGDFQSLVVTIVAVIAYLVALVGWQEHIFLTSQTQLPDVGNTILTIFGAGQATYLLKKAFRTDAIKDFGLELQPEVITVIPKGTTANVNLSVLAAPNTTVAKPTVKNLTGQGAAISVGAAQTTGLITNYLISFDTKGVNPGEYTYEAQASNGSKIQTIIGKYRVT